MRTFSGLRLILVEEKRRRKEELGDFNDAMPSTCLKNFSLSVNDVVLVQVL
jgi:hypothetical protein